MIVIYIFEIPIVAIVMLGILIGGIEPGEICRNLGIAWCGVGAVMSLWFLFGGYPMIHTTKEDRCWGIRIFLIAAMVLLFVLPGWEVYKVGLGMGDKMLMDLILGR